MSQRTRQLTLSDVTVRVADTGPAYIDGTAVPYDTPINYAGQTERFAPGSINADEVIGRPLLYGHNYSSPDAWLGTIVDAENTPAGLTVSAEVIDTLFARKLRDATRPPGLSVGVQIDAATMNDDQSVTYDAATLRELSVTTVPAYGDDAMIAAVRHTEPSEEDTMTQATPVTEAREAPVDLSPLTERLDSIEARMLSVTERPAAPQPIDVRRAFTDLVIAHGQDRAVRSITARADMVSSGNTGLTDPARTSQQILDTFDASRYFVSHVASIPFPATGVVHHLPKKTQHTQAGARAGEKQTANSRALQTGVDTFTGDWYDAYLDISYELIRTSSPGAVAVAVDDMLDQAAAHSEATFVAGVEAAATAGGAAIDFTDYSTFIASLRSAIKAIRAAAGAGAVAKFALTEASWDSLLALTDGDGRRILATVGPTNADGSAALTARDVTLAGVMLFESPSSTVDVAFSDVSLQRSELPPLQLSADNVPNIGRDVAILGNIMVVDRVPAGIIKFSA